MRVLLHQGVGGVQTGLVTLETSVRDSVKATRPTIKLSCASPWHMPKCLDVLPDTCLLSDVHCFSNQSPQNDLTMLQLMSV